METILYRFENKDKEGIFWSGLQNVITSIGKRHERIRNGVHDWPGYRQDEDLYQSVDCIEDYIFAYLTLSQCRKAITKREYRLLKEHDMYFYRIKVSRCIRTKHQAIFMRKYLRKKERIELY